MCRKAPKFVPEFQLGVKKSATYINTLPRTLGIEMEIGDWKNLSKVQHIPHISYTTTHDWSVKPSETEMVLTPMVGDRFITGMLSLSYELETNKCELNETCAMHVHVGGKDLGAWDIRKLLEVYSRIEPEIYQSFIAPYRRKTSVIHYCQMMTQPHEAIENGMYVCARCARYDSQYPGERVPPEPIETVLSRMRQARSTADLKLCLLRMLYGIENPSLAPTVVQTRKGGKYEFCRYFGLNLHSWQHRLTIEWRMKEATADPIEMVFWPLWCGWVVQAITRMSDAESRSDRMNVRYLTEHYMPGFMMRYVEEKLCTK